MRLAVVHVRFSGATLGGQGLLHLSETLEHIWCRRPALRAALAVMRTPAFLAHWSTRSCLRNREKQ